MVYAEHITPRNSRENVGVNILLDMKMYGYMIYVDITLCNREPYNLHMVQTPDFTS